MTQVTSPLGLGRSAIPTRNARPAETLALEDRALFGQLVDELVTCSLVMADEWHGLGDERRAWGLAAHDQNDLIDRLAECGLLTEYQSHRIKAGTVYGLVLGNYRVLERIGAGGMGIVF